MLDSRKYARAYILIQTLEALTVGWFMTTYVLFILSTGATLLDASIANVVFMITNFLLDPLTGKWGDLYGYRRVYLLGGIVWGLGTLAYFLSFNLLHFCIAECLSAIGRALMSEALESWLQNSVEFDQAVAVRAKAESRFQLVNLFAAILGGIIGSLFGYRLPWLLCALSSLVVCILSWRILRKFPREVHLEQSREINLSVTAGWKMSWQQPNLRFSLIYTGIVFGAFAPFNMFYAPLMRQISGQSWWIGFLWLGISMAIAYGASFTGKYIKVGEKTFFVVLLLVAIPIVIASASQNIVFVVAGFLIHELPRATIRNFSATYANPHIKNHERSMLNSIRSAVATFGAAIGLVVSGIFSQYMSIQAVWLISALVLTFYAGVIWLKYGKT